MVELIFVTRQPGGTAIGLCHLFRNRKRWHQKGFGADARRLYDNGSSRVAPQTPHSLRSLVGHAALP